MNKNKYIIYGVFVFTLLVSCGANAQYLLDPTVIYRQAKVKNYRLLTFLSFYY